MKDVGIALDLFDRTAGREISRNPAPTVFPIDPVHPAVESVEADDADVIVLLEICPEPLEKGPDLFAILVGTSYTAA